MVHTLPLHDLATKVGLGDILVFRPVATAMYQLAIESLGPLRAGDIISCCFAEIKSCDVSFVDEFLLGLQEMVLTSDNVVLRLTDCCQDVLDSVEGALEVRNKKKKGEQKLTLLYFKNGQYTTLGNETAVLTETLAFVRAHSEGVSARDLVNYCQDVEEINAASTRLKRLYDAKLVFRRTENFDQGYQNIYYLPND